jgi:hypothetical protein
MSLQHVLVALNNRLGMSDLHQQDTKFIEGDYESLKSEKIVVAHDHNPRTSAPRP